MDKNPKRRIISAKECKHDLREFLMLLFRSVNQGIDKYNEIISMFSLDSRVRCLESTVLNAKIIESLQSNFADKWRFGKYKRFILQLNGYSIFPKKLNYKDLPMNIKTKFVEAIQNQSQTSLFDNSSFAETLEPIIFLGYKQNKFGEIIEPKLVYIDEGKLKFTINESDIFNENMDDDNMPTGPINVPDITIRPDIQRTKKAN